jgi:hypothetical protein
MRKASRSRALTGSERAQVTAEDGAPVAPGASTPTGLRGQGPSWKGRVKRVGAPAGTRRLTRAGNAGRV